MKTPTRQQAASAHRGAVRRIALFLEVPVSRVEANIPNALQDVLCRLPWDRALRRERDHVILDDVRFLFERMEPDDLRRRRLKFLIEHAERRARL